MSKVFQEACPPPLFVLAMDFRHVFQVVPLFTAIYLQAGRFPPRADEHTEFTLPYPLTIDPPTSRVARRPGPCPVCGPPTSLPPPPKREQLEGEFRTFSFPSAPPEGKQKRFFSPISESSPLAVRFLCFLHRHCLSSFLSLAAGTPKIYPIPPSHHHHHETFSPSIFRKTPGSAFSPARRIGSSSFSAGPFLVFLIGSIRRSEVLPYLTQRPCPVSSPPTFPQTPPRDLLSQVKLAIDKAPRSPAHWELFFFARYYTVMDTPS